MFGVSRDTLLLRKAAVRRRSKLAARQLLGSVGQRVPFSTKLFLARRSSKLAYLLLKDGDLILEDYLDCYRFKVNARFEIQRTLISGSYEPDVLAVIRNHVREGNHCIDVGANIGALAFAMAKQVGDSGRVTCFEPGGPYLQHLRENIELNPSLSFVIESYHLGLSDKEGEMLWGEDIDFPGNAWLLGDRGTPVSVTTLDRFLERHPIPRLDFIKIDIEGMEWEMLSGSRETLQKYHPTILFETRLETEASRGMPVLKMVEELLRSFGYELYRVDNRGNLLKTRYPAFSPNTLAIRR